MNIQLDAALNIREGSAEEPQVRSPFFIIGVARSGTTLLRLLLDAHSAIAIPYESHFIVRFARRQFDFTTTESRAKAIREILDVRYVKEWDCKIGLKDIELEKCADLGTAINQVFSAYARKRGKSVWGDKTPSYVGEIDTLNRLFPNARYIHIIRDGRDVASSLVQQWWGPTEFVTAIEHWERSVCTAMKMLRMLPQTRFLTVRFEDLVVNTELELRRILDFLQLAYEPQMIETYRDSAGDKVGFRINRHHVNLKRPPSADQCFKWKDRMSKSDQAIAYEKAGKLLEQFGYESGAKQSSMRLLRKAHHRAYEIYAHRLRPRHKGDFK